MKILVIGGTGFISSRLVELLVEAGHNVTVLTRGITSRPLPDGVDFLIGDRSSELTLESVIGRKFFDAVFDMVAYLPQESAAAVRVLKGRVARFIHCSTISVYMVSDKVECPITEDQDRAPVMNFWGRNPFGMEYGIRKRECEDLLWKAHDEKNFPVSMLRPTFVSGPGDPTKRDYFWVERILDGQPLIVPGTGKFLFQQVFVEDVARAFVSLLDQPSSVGKAYNVASEETYTLNEYLTMLATILERTLDVVHVNQEEFDDLPFSQHKAGDVFPFNVRRTALFSLDRIKADLGYRSTPFRTWMPQTISWFASRTSQHSVGYERRGEEAEFIRQRKILHIAASSKGKA
jgi:nucleoside-diphosphate-sugar epimerase